MQAQQTMSIVADSSARKNDRDSNNLSSAHVGFMRLPGEIRNHIYDFIIHDFSPTYSPTMLLAIAFTNIFIHREFMSRLLLYIECNIGSMQDIWFINMLAAMHPQPTMLRSLTKFTISNFTTFAYTQSRANEVMDFLSQFESVQALTLGFALSDLRHGFQGRVKSIDHVLLDLELYRLCDFKRLAKVIIRVRCSGALPCPYSAALLSELEDWIAERFMVEVVFLHTE